MIWGSSQWLSRCTVLWFIFSFGLSAWILFALCVSSRRRRWRLCESIVKKMIWLWKKEIWCDYFLDRNLEHNSHLAYLLHRQPSCYAFGTLHEHVMVHRQPLDYHARYRNQCYQLSTVANFSFSFFPKSEIPALSVSNWIWWRKCDQYVQRNIRMLLALLVALAVPMSAIRLVHGSCLAYRQLN